MPSAWLSTKFKAARPRTLAALNRYFGDIDLAEDAFQEASLKALRSWTRETIPADPAAWLIVAGRNFGIDQIRKRRKETSSTHDTFEPAAHAAGGEAETAEHLDRAQFRDDVLRLLFTCCHPVLRRDQQIALALKIVAGLSVEETARAFLVKPKTMEQRITRAKKRLRAAKLSFDDPPGHEERARRLASVTLSIYLLFNEGYSAAAGDALIRVTLCEEAIRLARLLSRLFAGEPEVRGLLALCLAQHARHRARLSPHGEAVTLENQDRALWDWRAISEAQVLLEAALRHRRPGPHQIEAAIALTHTHASTFEDTDWAEIERLYRALERVRPSPVVTLNRAAALARVKGPDAALDLVLPAAAALQGYSAFHAAVGAFHAELGRRDAAREAFAKAIDLAGTETERAHIRDQIAAL